MSINSKHLGSNTPTRDSGTLHVYIGNCTPEETSVPIPPTKALQVLLDGNHRYLSNHVQRPDQRPADSPQHPIAVILSCSDSRVPPEIIFDQGLGKLFVVRVAGNTYDRLALESIQYAVTHLGTTLI